MRQAGIRSLRAVRRRVRTTDSQHRRPVAPNVLFVMDESGSMRWDLIRDGVNRGDTDSRQRMNQLQAAMETVFDNSDNDNINAGILAYTTRTNATRVVHDFANVGASRNSLKNAVGDPDVAGDGLRPLSGTPSVHALASAVQWYETSFRNSTSPIATDPEDNWCKPNYIVFMTDGQPNSNTTTADLGPELNLSTNPDTYRGTTCTRDDGVTPGNGNWPNWHGDSCSGQIVNWAVTTDLRTGAGWDGTQNITTHTVGMGPAADPTPTNDGDDNNEVTFMKYVATQGGGQYFPATNAAQLTTAFQQILNQAGASIPFTYMAPTIPFNPSSAGMSGDALYVPLFEPGPEGMWYGNVKKYKLTYEQLITPTPTDPAPPMSIVIRDKNNNEVVDTSDMSFNNGVVDLWNGGGSDGGDPLVGGAIYNLSGTRNLYTWLTGNSADLTDQDNQVVKTNALLDATVLGDLANDTDMDGLAPAVGATFTNRKDAILDWINWIDINNVPDGNGGTVTVSHVNEMGAALHTNPAVVTHDGDDYVFVATTEGILHALDGDNGEELWAFIPQELLERVASNFKYDWNDAKPHDSDEQPIPADDHGHFTNPQNYGLDGPTVVYELEDGRRFLVQGMRRGGRNYYALDITNPNDPKMAWDIIGGSGDFTAMGQTWSKPVFTKVEMEGSAAREVLIFGGGYDDDQDSSYTDSQPDGVFNSGDTAIGRVNDDVGNIIYIVDAEDGDLLKTISTSAHSPDVTISDMLNGIASDITTVDINANGITDRLYAADVGGRIIRVDIPDNRMSIVAASNITGAIVADVNGDSTAGTEFQRFFAAPAAAFFKSGGMQYISLIVSSGHRPEPLSRSVDTDRLYVIKDWQVWIPPQSPVTYPAPLTENDLYDATANDIQDGSPTDQVAAAAALSLAPGWYIDLPDGEKGFSPATVYNYAILFTTYTGERGASSDSCRVVNTQGSSYLYAIDMRDGRAMFAAMDGDPNNLQGSDRKRLLKIPGLPPGPSLVFPDPGDGHLSGDVIGLVGLEEGVTMFQYFLPIYWEEVIND
jgi:type IV pilus assembly protein PilY1